MPGMRVRNTYVTSDGALRIESPSTEDSGHYACAAINAVGATIARSHLTVFDENKPEAAENEGIADLEAEEARLALLERTIGQIDAAAVGPNSIKITWSLGSQEDNKYVDGFRLHYRRRRTDRYESFKSADIDSSVTSFTVNGLEEYVEYEVFVLPMHGRISGQPSHIRLARTHQVRVTGRKKRSNSENNFI